MSSFNFKDNLTIDNSKFLKFLDVTGVTKNNIIGLDSNSHLHINSSNVGDVYLNSNTTQSNTFINASNSFGNTFVGSKLAVGINNTSNINTNIVLPSNGIIGLNTTQGTHSGFLALAGSSSLLNTTGSKMILYGNDNTSGNGGQIKLFAGNNASGNINVYTGNDILRMQVLSNGNTNFQPDGTTIRLAVSDINTTITNRVIISSTEQSTSPNTGALQIIGGIGIGGNTFINGSLNVNSVVGNINFTSSTESTSYTSGATYLVGGLGIQCSTDSFSQTAGGALSVAGGFALGKSAKIGGNITIYDSSASTSALNGSGIFYGGVGVNGQLNIRSNTSSQIRLIPVNTGNETSLFFGNQNNYTTSGSWTIGQNVNSIGQSKFGIYNPEQGNYIILDANILLEKYTTLADTLNFTNTTIDDLITIRNSNGDVNWSIGKISNGNEDFQISRFTVGNLIDYLITADTPTGNITIYGTQNSISSISGGSLTVNGGASIAKDLRIGGDIIGGNVNFTGNLVSNSSVDVNSFSYLTLTSTDESLSSTSGSLVSFGGISIQCTTDTVSSTNGGSFVTDGGMGIAKSLIVGNTISSTTLSTSNAYITQSTINNMYSTNITAGDIIVTNISASSIRVGPGITLSGSTLSAGTVNVTTVLGNTKVQTPFVTSTNVLSDNITSGSIITTLLTTNSLYSTYSTITNIISDNNTISNLILNSGSFGSLNISNGLDVLNGLNSSFNSNTLGTLYTTNGNVGIGSTSPTSSLYVSGNMYVGPEIYTGSGLVNALVEYPKAVFSTQTNGFPSTSNSIGNAIALRARGADNAVLDIGVNSLNGSWIQSTNFLNYSTKYPLLLNPNGGNVVIGSTAISSFTLDVNGSLRSQNQVSINNTVNNITNNIGSVNFSSDIALSNTTRNSIIFSQAGINPPTLTTRSIGTKLNLYPNVSGSDMDYAIGIETNSMWYSSPSFKWYSNITSANMILTSTGLGINTNNLNPNFALEVIGTGKISSSFSALGNSNTLGNLYTTSGNVGINNISPSFTLDVTGTGRFTTSFNAVGNSNTIGNLFTTGGNVGIQNTSPNQRLEISSISYAANQDGGLRISTKDYISLNDPSYRYIDIRLQSDTSSYYRGSIIGTLSGGVPTEYEYMSFSQDGFTNVYSQTLFTDPTSCSNSSVASVVLAGGLSIDCPTNATNISNGGALTVLGGAAIAGDLIVGGSILYSNAEAASSTFAYLTLTSTDFSTDIGNGSLVTFGGISVQCTADAYSSTEGNGITIAGGAGIGASLYVGTIGYIPTVISTNNTTINAALTNTTSTNLYITNGLRSEFNSNTLGNLFTTGGNVGIGLVNPQRKLHVDNSIRIGNTDATLDFGDDLTTQIYRNGTVSELRFNTNSISRITITSTGNIGIGNTNPNFALDITGITNLRNTSDSLNSTTGALISNGGISVSNTTNATSTTMGGALTVAGGTSILKDVYVGGTITSSSDRFLKKNIKHLPSILDKISNINPVTYNSINDSDTKNYIGFIAQDFKEHFPELLRRENENSFYSLGYDRITALNFKCIKELLDEINKLKVIIKTLQ
jgi:hypothetical protein